MTVYCQQCGKKFLNTVQVLDHMNQPISSCQTYYEELLQIAETAGSPTGVQSGIFPEDQPHASEMN